MKNEFDNIPIKGFEVLRGFNKGGNMSTVNVPSKPKVEIGIQETKEGVKAVVLLANAIIKTLADGKVNIFDLGNFISPLVAFPKAFSGIDKIPLELSDLSEQEFNELVSLVESELQLNNEKTKKIIVQSLDILYQLYELIKIIKDEN